MALATIVGVIFARSDLNYFEASYVVEDGPIEWLTFLGLSACSLLCMYHSYLFRRENWTSRLAPFFMIFLFIFGAGEEISWGQRIFGFSSGEFFQSHNSQMETNLHNLILSGHSVNRILFGTVLAILIVLYLAVLPQVYRRVKKLRDLVDSFSIPICRFDQFVWYLILVSIIFTIPSHKKGEILEFVGSWFFFLIIWRPANEHIYE